MPTDVYSGTTMLSSQITRLMRRINALEAGVVIAGGGGTFARKWGSVGSSNGQFTNPDGIEIAGGEVYVADISNDRIQVFNTAGTFQRKWGITGSGDGELNDPQDVVVFSSEVYVSDSSNNRVQVFDTSGAYQRKWGSVGSGNGQFANSAMNGLCVFGGEVYVCDSGNNRIQVFSTAGTYQRQWGSIGSGDGQFSVPSDIFGYNSELYVADVNNNRIQVFNSSGTFQRKWGSSGSGNGQFAGPSGLTVSSGGVVYVADTLNNRIQVFTTSGSFVEKWGAGGTGNGQFNTPGSCVDSGGELYVSDTSNNRIQVFVDSGGAPYTQTTFYSYLVGVPTSLGTPDGGVSVPALDVLKPAYNNADLSRLHIVDMRTALQVLAPYFTNAATGNPFNWTASSADNAYFVAMGDRSAYGATGGAAYDWTRTSAQMLADFCYGIDVGEIHEVCTLLEAS